ncbi:MAG: MoxR-like ATPase in aerotolerance operon, partial [uncultured Solirubrobacteraceae bacterium]
DPRRRPARRPPERARRHSRGGGRRRRARPRSPPGRVVRVQARRRRPGRDARAPARRHPQRRSRAAGGRAGTGQDVDRPHPVRSPGGQLQPRPVHPGPRPRRPRRDAHLAARSRRVPDAARPGVRQPPARRRDQPRTGQGPVGAAGGHAGAPGDDRRCDLPRAGAVPGAGHAEPDRVRGHLCAARGPGRPLPVQADARLPLGRGRDRRGRSHGRRAAAPAHRPRSGRSDRLPPVGPRGVRRSCGQDLRRTAVGRHAPSRALRAAGAVGPDRVRRQPARLDRPRPGRSGAGHAARPHARDGRRRPRPRRRRAAPPPGPLLRRPRRRRASRRPGGQRAGRGPPDVRGRAGRRRGGL